MQDPPAGHDRLCRLPVNRLSKNVPASVPIGQEEERRAIG
jgi:hypothetical protein